MRLVFDVLQEPRGEVLHVLFRALAPRSSSILMVLRDDLGLSQTGQGLLSRLQPHLLERTQGSEWPGTKLLDDEATILRFASSDGVLNELMIASEGLYGWCQPDLPEDLAFIREDGTAILTSICHEHDAYLAISDDEYQSLVVSVPNLVDILHRRQSPSDIES